MDQPIEYCVYYDKETEEILKESLAYSLGEEAYELYTEALYKKYSLEHIYATLMWTQMLAMAYNPKTEKIRIGTLSRLKMAAYFNRRIRAVPEAKRAEVISEVQKMNEKYAQVYEGKMQMIAPVSHSAGEVEGKINDIASRSSTIAGIITQVVESLTVFKAADLIQSPGRPFIEYIKLAAGSFIYDLLTLRRNDTIIFHNPNATAYLMGAN